MKILIVGLVKNEQFRRLREEGEKRGHEVEGCYTKELVIRCDRTSFTPSLRGRPMDRYDLIYLWVVGRKRWEWYLAAEYLNRKHGIIIVNQKSIAKDYNYFLTPAADYLKQTESNFLFPESAIVFDSRGVESVINNFRFPLVLKVSGGRKGRWVFKMETLEELMEKIEELKEVPAAFIIREFIPNDGDIRIFTVGYRAIGAMKRTPTKEGEFRSNISQGGKGEEFDLKKHSEVKRIAEKLSKITRTEIAGVDIMLHKETGQPYILEINPGPQFAGFEEYTDKNAAREIIKYFEELFSSL